MKRSAGRPLGRASTPPRTGERASLAYPLTWGSADAAFLLGMSREYVVRLAARGELPGAYRTTWYRNAPGGPPWRRIAWRIPDAAIRGYQATRAAEEIERRRPVAMAQADAKHGRR